MLLGNKIDLMFYNTVGHHTAQGSQPAHGKMVWLKDTPTALSETHQPAQRAANQFKANTNQQSVQGRYEQASGSRARGRLLDDHCRLKGSQWPAQRQALAGSSDMPQTMLVAQRQRAGHLSPTGLCQPAYKNAGTSTTSWTTQEAASGKGARVRLLEDNRGLKGSQWPVQRRAPAGFKDMPQAMWLNDKGHSTIRLRERCILQ